MTPIPRKLLVLLALPSVVLLAQDKTPERTVAANVITSERDPSLRIELPKQVRYAGADRWILYGVADCEVHVFAEADSQKNVPRLYWVQFAGYLPSKPDSKYNYHSPRNIKLAGMDFDVTVRVGPNMMCLGQARIWNMCAHWSRRKATSFQRG